MSDYPVGAKWKCVNRDGTYAFVWLERRDGQFEVWRWNWQHSDGSHAWYDTDWGTSRQDVINQVKSNHSMNGRFKRVEAMPKIGKKKPAADVIVIPSRESDQPNHYETGYTLKWVGTHVPSWIVGQRRCYGWFKFKRDAQKRADTYNRKGR